MSLQDDALLLAELDNRLIRALEEQNAEVFGAAAVAYWQLRRDLNRRILNEPTATIKDPPAAAIIRKISGGEGLPSDRVIERFLSNSGEKYSIEEFTDEEIEELGHEIFYIWFSHHEYVQGLRDLRPLILRNPVSEFISRLVRQVRDCYAFQQYDAAYGLCRTLIEACVRDICVRRNLFPDLGENVVLFEKYQWCKLRDKVSSGPLQDQLKELYAELSSLVHGRKAVTQQEARHAFKATLEVVEGLYALNGF